MKFFTDTNKNYGKPFLVVASLVVWTMLILMFKLYGYDNTWKLWRVPVEQPQFSDFRLIPGSAESFRMGFEPTQWNPGDPHKRIFNYPAFWRLFFYTDITEDNTLWIVPAMWVLFFVGVFLFPQKLTGLDSLAMLFIIFSPASMLLYERGNVDLIVFFLCALIVWSVDLPVLVTAILLIVAVVVKIFPFFGFTVLLKESKSAFVWLSLTCLTMLLVYMVSTSGSVSASWNLTMRGDEISYGANVLFLRYSQYFSDLFGVSPTDLILKFVPIVLAAFLIFISGMIGVTSHEPLRSSSARNLAAFRMGASIYMGTFLLGNNWDYRLVFLIFAVPQLLHWIRQSNHQRYRFVTSSMLGFIFLSCWHFVAWFSPSLQYLQEFLFIFDEIVNWMLVLGLNYLFFASVPVWVKERFQVSFPKKMPFRLNK